MIHNFSYGLRRFFIKEDILPPNAGYDQLVAKNQVGLIHDIKLAYEGTSFLKPMDNVGYFQTILNKQKFDDYVRFKVGALTAQSLNREQNKQSSLMQELTKNSLNFDKRAVKKQLMEMQSQISLRGSQFMLWYFNKAFRNGFHGIFVDTNSLNNVKSLLQKN